MRTRRRARLYPYLGRIIRPAGRDETYGARRTLSGFRYVRAVYSGLQLMRARSDAMGERSLYAAGSVGDPQFRFQADRHLPDVQTDDELIIVGADGSLEAFNIVSVFPSEPRVGLNGRQIGGYTIIQVRRKAENAQTADKDIYL